MDVDSVEELTVQRAAVNANVSHTQGCLSLFVLLHSISIYFFAWLHLAVSPHIGVCVCAGG